MGFQQQLSSIHNEIKSAASASFEHSLVLSEAIEWTLRECATRGLDSTASWLCELCLSCTHSVSTLSSCWSPNLTKSFDDLENELVSDIESTNQSPKKTDFPSHSYQKQSENSRKLHLVHQLALSLFHRGEFQRVYHILSSFNSHENIDHCFRIGFESSEIASSKMVTSDTQEPIKISFAPPSLLPESRFLCFYARYMAGEKELAKYRGSSIDKGINPYLSELFEILELNCQSFPNDAFLSWLFAVISRDLKKNDFAIKCFFRSLQINPFLWCSWCDLETVVSNFHEIKDICSVSSLIAVPFMGEFFLLHLLINSNYEDSASNFRKKTGVFPLSGSSAEPSIPYSSQEEKYEELDEIVSSQLSEKQISLFINNNRSLIMSLFNYLLQCFPNFGFIKIIQGKWYAIIQEYDKASTIYSDFYRKNPFDLTGCDSYSDILLLKESRNELVCLAQHVFKVDSCSPEANYVVGNFFSLQKLYDRSILYYRKALNLNPAYASVWTLLGKSYLELKNLTAALDSYKMAIKCDNQDYCAYYNLGQISELLEIHSSAVFYYQKAICARPFNSEIWKTMGRCLCRLERFPEAIQCLEYVLCQKDEILADSSTANILRLLTLSYKSLGNIGKALYYISRLVASILEKRKVLSDFEANPHDNETDFEDVGLFLDCELVMFDSLRKNAVLFISSCESDDYSPKAELEESIRDISFFRHSISKHFESTGMNCDVILRIQRMWTQFERIKKCFYIPTEPILFTVIEGLTSWQEDGSVVQSTLINAKECLISENEIDTQYFLTLFDSNKSKEPKEIFLMEYICRYIYLAIILDFFTEYFVESSVEATYEELLNYRRKVSKRSYIKVEFS